MTRGAGEDPLAGRGPGCWLVTLSCTALVGVLVTPLWLLRDPWVALYVGPPIGIPVVLALGVTVSWLAHVVRSRPRRVVQILPPSLLAAAWALVLGLNAVAFRSEDIWFEISVRQELARVSLGLLMRHESPEARVVCPGLRYEPEGPPVDFEKGGSDPCPSGVEFDCWDLDVCTRRGRTCEPSTKVEAFRAGPCADCVEVRGSRWAVALACSWSPS